MALRNYTEVIEGLQETGGTACGCVCVKRNGMPSINVTLVLLATSSTTATDLDCFLKAPTQKNAGETQACGTDPGACSVGSLTINPPLTSMDMEVERPTAVVALLTDWVSSAWVCCTTVEEIIKKSGASSDKIRTRDEESSAGCILFRGAVVDWRALFPNLFRFVSTASGALRGDARAENVEVTFSELQSVLCLREVKSAATSLQVILWVGSRLACGFSRQSARLAQLQRKNDVLRTEVKGMSGASCSRSLQGESGEAAEARFAVQGQSPSTPPAPQANRPISLVNPQVRVGVKRTRGMRLQ